MPKLEKINVMSNSDSLAFIKQHKSSVARFGDGEIDIICGHSIPYQDYDLRLAGALKMILETPSRPELLVCLPDVFHNIERYNTSAQKFWCTHFERYQLFYEQNCRSDWYGSTFLSRPYMDLVDKSDAKPYFEALKDLWRNQDILIVEGETSRSGMGNDLFAEAKSIQRVICPSRNAFTYYDEILKTIERYGRGRLILLMLGPTAKILVHDLSRKGVQAIDIGHIDSEYEWYQMGATHKVKLSHKHTAEFNRDNDIAPVRDKEYDNQIIAKVGLEEELTLPPADDGLISVIVPVYNVKPYLARCLDSLLKQTYDNLEIILVNDGSTDGSGQVCEEYAQKDKRIRLIHQENAGVSAARNKAIDLARGEFITFIDSDDFVEDYYLDHLYQAALRTDSDIVVTNFSSFNEERQSFLFYHTKESFFEKTFSVQEWLDKEGDWKHNLHLVFTFSHLKLFKRELFGSIRYPVGRLREDDATIYKLYFKANQIHFINEGAYYYSQRLEGLSRNAMLSDIAGMVRNAEERLALVSSLGYETTKTTQFYIARLKKCQADALLAGQIDLYRDITTKIELYEYHRRL